MVIDLARVILLWLVAGAGLALAQQLPLEVWRSYAGVVAAEPGVVRFYSLKNGGAQYPDLTGSAAVMRYKGSGVTRETGRVAGSEAVVLDGDSFETAALLAPSNALTIAMWVRPIGMGTKRGNNGAVNGMLLCCGSGYHDGWRVALYDWQTRRPSFELGRPQGALGARATIGLSRGFWNHLAVAWDGAVTRFYINGQPAGEFPMAESLVAPAASLKLGYAGFGVGSLRMAVDEVALFDRALGEERIARLALSGVELPQAIRAQVAEMDTTAASLSLYEGTAVPAHLRGMAAEHLLAAAGRGEELPSRILRELPDYFELDADEQQQAALLLAQAYAREGNREASSVIYERLLSFEGLDARRQAEVRSAYAEALLLLGDFDGAAAQHALVAEMAEVAPYVRALAALALARVWRHAGKPEQAAAHFAAVASLEGVPHHLLAEARECAAECANLAAGRPARDPEQSRQRLPVLPEPAVRFFVAPDGQDANAGTLKAPFATLERARQAVNSQRVKGALPAGGVTVYLRGGVYTVTNTFKLSAADSGGPGAPVVYRAWQSEKPVFDGGLKVRGLRRVKDAATLARMKPEARGAVYVADLKQQWGAALEAQRGYGFGIDNQRVWELYADGAPLPPARWPKNGFAKTGAVLDATNHVFRFEGEHLARWSEADNLMVSGYWCYLWANCAVPARINLSDSAFEMTERPGQYGVKEGQPFYVFNLLEELDQPGEWCLDYGRGLLYLWPRRHPWFGHLVISRLAQPFIQADNLRETVFKGLTFEHGQQHGVVLNQCVNTVVAGCVLRRLGGTALLAPRCANLKVYGNIMHTLGHTGMQIGGGDRRQLVSGGISIENNEIHSFGHRARTYAPALLLEGCGARVAHNTFHHAPSSAMRIEGNDHLIEFNLVHNVVQESDDQGAIDMWGNPSYRGVVIRYNHWRDIGGGLASCGQAGIRFDDAISGMLVYGNLFERCSTGNFGGVQIHGGHHNIVDNNVFLDCRYGVSTSAWGQKRWEEYLAREHIRRQLFAEVNIRLPLYLKRYPELAALGREADINSVWRNRFIGSATALFKQPRGSDIWCNRREALGGDASAEHSALFRTPPFKEAGLYHDTARAVETVGCAAKRLFSRP